MNVLFYHCQTEPLPSPSLSRLVSVSPAACESPSSLAVVLPQYPRLPDTMQWVSGTLSAQ